jgi:hypothetical protein
VCGGEEGKAAEADHTPPSTAEIKNGGAIPPLPLQNIFAILMIEGTAFIRRVLPVESNGKAHVLRSVN